MIRAYSSWKSKISISNYFLRSIKKRFAKQKSYLKCVHLCTQYLVRGPLAQTPASVMCGMEATHLWHCWGTIEPSAHLDYWIDCFSSFSWKYPISGSGQACWLISTNISNYNYIMVSKALASGFGSVGRCQVLLEKEISISIKLVSRWKHKVLQNLLVDGCIDFGLDKTQWTNTSRCHGSPNHHWLWKLHTGLQAAWILCLSSLPPDSGTLIYKWKAKCTFIWKEDFGALSNSPVLYLRSPGKMLLMMFLFQKWLVALFLKMSERGDSWCTDSSFSSLLVKLSQVFESALLDSILKRALIPVACAHFPTHFLPSSQLCI